MGEKDFSSEYGDGDHYSAEVEFANDGDANCYLNKFSVVRKAKRLVTMDQHAIYVRDVISNWLSSVMADY